MPDVNPEVRGLMSLVDQVSARPRGPTLQPPQDLPPRQFESLSPWSLPVFGTVERLLGTIPSVATRLVLQEVPLLQKAISLRSTLQPMLAVPHLSTAGFTAHRRIAAEAFLGRVILDKGIMRITC